MKPLIHTLWGLLVILGLVIFSFSTDAHDIIIGFAVSVIGAIGFGYSFA